MHIKFQTEHTEGNTRLNASLLDYSFIAYHKQQRVALIFDRSTYDRDELGATIERLTARGNQNMIIEDDALLASLVVEPEGTPIFDEDIIIIRYKVLARTDH